jgi:hypothetical protein
METDGNILMVDIRKEDQIKDLGIIGTFYSYHLLPLEAAPTLEARGIRYVTGNKTRMKAASEQPIYSLLERRPK